ncbi:MAG: dephospho-CoA kinase [Candidatus Didemnitutus sp.]|nr:dephospho-CoA kinase [Candidatus Didemnitutus sp.]
MAEGGNLIVGLTGGMGSGKSTAAGMFAELGFRRLDADQVVREVLLPHAEVIAAVREHFGATVLDQDGRIDRERLGAIVFAADAALQWLEELLHPRIYHYWQGIYAAARGEKFIVEVPLLFEKHLANRFDFTVCVSTNSELQLRRLEQRGVPPGIARQRLAKQLPLARKCELADFVLLNDGTLEFLREQVSQLASRLSLTQHA